MKVKAALLGGVVIFALPAQVWAQAAGAEDSDRSGLSEIVVNAQRREERGQDVPISITAISAEDLGEKGIARTDQLESVVPGLTIFKGATGVSQYIRGIGVQDVTSGNEPAVSTYVDGVYIADFNAGVFSLKNIGSVEVLKGPQGTLFGRNATGGLISVKTRDPAPGFGVEGTVGYGNYDTYEGSLYVSGGNDVIAADISGYFIRQNEGFSRNVDLNVKANHLNETVLRSKVVFNASDADKITLIGDWSTNKGVQFARNFAPGSLGAAGKPAYLDPYETGGSIPAQVTDSYRWGGSLKWEHDFAFGTLSLLSAYRKAKIAFQYDNDLYADIDLVRIYVTDRSRSFQSELVLTGETGRLKYSTGLFYLDIKGGFSPLSTRSTTPALLGQNLDTFTPGSVKSYAAFAQVDFAVTDTTNITVGARYTIDKRVIDGRRVAAPGFVAAPVGTVVQSRHDEITYKEPTWRIGINQKLSPDIMLYANYNRGFKSGLYQATDFTGPPVKPEKLDAFEVGLKSDFADIFRFNAAAFWYEYKNQQVSSVTNLNPTALILTNAASSRIRGLDLDLTAAPNVGDGRLTLNAGLSLLDAKFKSFPNAPISTPRPTGGNLNGVTNPPTDLSGRDTPRAPEWTLNLSANFVHPVGAGELGLNVSYYHNDGFNWEADGRLKQPSYDLLNSEIRYSFGAESQYAVRLWGRNLTKSLYYVYGIENSAGDFVTPAQPRTYGIAFDFKF